MGIISSNTHRPRGAEVIPSIPMKMLGSMKTLIPAEFL